MIIRVATPTPAPRANMSESITPINVLLTSLFMLNPQVVIFDYSVQFYYQQELKIYGSSDSVKSFDLSRVALCQQILVA